MSMIRRNLERRKAQKTPLLKGGKLETLEKKKYTKTDINRMPTAELKTLAAEHGINDADTMTGAEIKKVLIEKLEL